MKNGTVSIHLSKLEFTIYYLTKLLIKLLSDVLLYKVNIKSRWIRVQYKLMKTEQTECPTFVFADYLLSIIQWIQFNNNLKTK